MFGRARRQRRRLALCILLGAAAGAAIGLGGRSGATAAALAGGTAAGLAAVLAVLLAPAWRWFVLKLAAVALIAALFWRLAGTAPVPTVLAALAAAVALPSRPVVLDRIRLPFVTRARIRRELPVSPRRLWRALFPGETTAHWDPHLRAVLPGPTSGEFVFVYRPLGHEPGLRIPVLVFDVDEGAHFKTRDLSLPPAREGGPVTVTSFVLDPANGGTALTVMEATWRQGLWTAFALWLDDYLGDHVDRMAALLEGRPDRSLRGAVLRSAARDRPVRPGRPA